MGSEANGNVKAANRTMFSAMLAANLPMLVPPNFCTTQPSELEFWGVSDANDGLESSWPLISSSGLIASNVERGHGEGRVKVGWHAILFAGIGRQA